MNANLTPKKPVIKDWLDTATRQLSAADIPTSRLDAELILADAIKKDRAYLHAHPEQIIYSDHLQIAKHNIRQRMNRTPIAYILSYKEFYGRNFFVNNSVLIPRPESETIIEVLKNIDSKTNLKLIDIGTGSGCLGITAKLEFPALDVTLIDISKEALMVAEQNSKNLSANVELIHSNLLDNYDGRPDIVIANLPYVDSSWGRSPETDHEPSIALFADDHGQGIIKKLISQASKVINTNGYLILEADPSQHDSLICHAQKYGYKLTSTVDYIITLNTDFGTIENKQ